MNFNISQLSARMFEEVQMQISGIFHRRNRIYVNSEVMTEYPIRFSFLGGIIEAKTTTELYHKAMLVMVQKDYCNARVLLCVRGFGFDLKVRNQIIMEQKYLIDYCFARDIYPLTVQFYCLNGGSQQVMVVNQATKMENTLVQNPKADISILENLKVQGAYESDPTEVMWAHVLKRMHEYSQSSPRSSRDVENDKEWVMCMIENVFQSYYWFRRTDNYLVWAQLVYKLFTGKSSVAALITKWQEIFGEDATEVQAEFEVGSTLKFLRKAFDSAQNLSEHPVLKKFQKLYTYLLVQGFLSRLGLELDADDYSKLELNALKATHSGKRGLWIAALDVLLFLAEKFYEFYETRDISVFMHTSSDYSEWLKETDRLLTLAPFTGNLEAHGTTYFAFIADLDRTIEKGEAYVKYSLLKAGYESAFLNKKLYTLKLMKSTTLTVDAALKSRKCPFGVLIYGQSGVGKTSVENMMFYYYAALRGLDNSESSKYTRNPLAEYWTNLRSSCWCILLDDVAFMDPRKCPDVDPTLKELILICNGVAYAPAQAALEDKGKTPILSELVMATTNTIHMNAAEYFSDPLAVQRRLPFVVTVEVKEEYRKQDSHMLDSSKLNMDMSVYPDYWRFTISKIEPIMQGDRERAKLVPFRMYEHSADFLQDFGTTAMAHLDNQTKFMECNKYMSGIGVCKKCMFPKYKCSCFDVQAGEVQAYQVDWAEHVDVSLMYAYFARCLRTLYNLYVAFFMWSVTMRWNLALLQWFLWFKCTRRFTYSLILWSLPGTYQMRLLGLLNSIKTVPRRWESLSSSMRLLVTVGLTAATGFALMHTFSSKSKGENKESEKKVPEKKEPVKKDDVPMTPVIDEVVTQGNMYSTTEDQLKKEERQNVWYNPVMETTPFDLPISSQSLVDATESTIERLFAQNVVRLNVSYMRNNERVTRTVCGVYVKGQYLMTEPHLFKDEMEVYTVEIVQGPVLDGVNPNLTFLLKRKEIVFDKDHELCMFRTWDNAPKKDILKFWMTNKDITIDLGMRILRQKNGRMQIQKEVSMQKIAACPIPELNLTLPVLTGVLENDTQCGDCGSLVVATIPRGTVLVGMHIVGHEKVAGSLIIGKDEINQLIDRVDNDDVSKLCVQDGAPPSLSCSKASYSLGPVNVRSKTRYLESGTVKVYGTLDVPRNRCKSCVEATPLQDEMCEHFDCKVEHCAPAMEGFEPWRNNLMKMVAPKCIIEKDVMKECAEELVNDWVRELPKGWEKNLCFLSRKAAVNGVPGVRYIDGINRDTSMGFPFNTGKRAYLDKDVDENYPEGVTFTEEIWKEYARIETCYLRGERANPVFAAHLKDEAVTLEKAKIKKTRVFTGSPVAWSLLVRSRLLSFVRLVQENKFVFEAGPGVVTMSSEWDRIRTYLTMFGDDRLFAGDYQTYDKGMIAYMILLAYWCIAQLYAKAGFPAHEVQQIVAIGYDTAFSWCNFDGDLLQFFGTNPSGHPLTVIINSIVNSLYMRYAYHKTNPKREVKTFKENVHLFTYGDDNCAGVSLLADWFNHTAVAAVMKSIGIGYTMADKKAESVPFININQVSFLKRTWRWDADMNHYLCPLDEASIHKSLTVWVRSKTLSSARHMYEVIKNCNNEFFYYGRERFTKEHNFFMQMLNHDKLSELRGLALTLPDWEELADRYRRSSVEMDAEYKEYDAKHGFGRSCL